ncbi:AAA family ATPase [Actinomarinicola tropica]|uniref:AAA family ATPase n=2 Tax=Actinomarinicola tropica TaxID=2789776 RepID=A0A5Q2RUW2_9ACTN|nr:AAA family ATPase [Actinomarinicola tropica]
MLIEAALERAEHVDVVVCDLEGQWPPAGERAGWLAEVHPTATVHAVADICGWHSPDPCPPGCSPAWARHLAGLGLGPWDLVVSSEDYGVLFAEALGAEHVMVDRERVGVPTSGTAIRADLAAGWRWLHPIVRRGLTRKVVVVGAESTGTTTLARDLADALGGPYVAEFGRAHSEVLAARFGSIDDVVWTAEDFAVIADNQEASERAALEVWAADDDVVLGPAGPWLVCDTDLLATAVWHERYLGGPTRELVERALAGERRPDLYVLTLPKGVPFEQDGLRDGEHLRDWMTERFREVLDESGVEWIEVAGSREERVAEVATLRSIPPVRSPGSNWRFGTPRTAPRATLGKVATPVAEAP